MIRSVISLVLCMALLSRCRVGNLILYAYKSERPVNIEPYGRHRDSELVKTVQGCRKQEIQERWIRSRALNERE